MENDATYPFTVSEDGTCLISGNKGVGRATSALKLTFQSAGTLRFDYRVSSEKNYDYLTVKHNGTELAGKTYSGNQTEFSTFTLDVLAEDVVEIGYYKDFSGDSNDDCVYLKNFSAAVYYTVTFTGCPDGTDITVRDSADNAYSAEDGAIALPAGTYTYTAEAFGYRTATGEFTVVDQTLAVPVVMEALPGQSVTFAISGLAEGVVPTVTVRHEETVMEPLADGTYSLVPGTYTYAVKAAGYRTARDSFTVAEEALTVSVAMVEGLEWDGAVGESFGGGSGAETDPYLISNGEELAYLSAQVAAGNAYSGVFFLVTQDIDLGNVAFQPIGGSATHFAGQFDGGRNTISNLLVSQTTDYAGLFGYIDGGAVVRGLTVKGSVSGKRYVGGIAGYINQASVLNCANYAGVTASGM